MSSSIVDSILGGQVSLGEFTGAGAVPAVDMPVVPMAGVRSQSLSKRVKAFRGRKKSDAVKKMLGDSLEEDANIIPDDAEEIPQEKTEPLNGMKMDVGDEIKDKGISEPQYGSKEPLMSPIVALVAPDATPQALEPLDTSKVPEPPKEAPGTSKDEGPNAMDVLLGKAKPVTSASSSVLPGIPSVESIGTGRADLDLTGGMGQALLRQGAAMPDHTVGTGASILEAMRKAGL